MNFSTAGYLRIKSSPNNAIRFIKTSFLQAIKYFRPSIGAIVLFEVFTLAGSQNWKKARWMLKRTAYILVWQRLWIMKLLHDSIYDPLKQTKKNRVVFDVSVNKRNVWKDIPCFPGWKLPGGNSDFMSSNLFCMLVSGFRDRFALNETDLDKW